MPARKGFTNNPHGRPKGTPNRTTKEIREALQKVIEAELDVLLQTLSQMEADRRLDIIFRLLPFVLPKLNPVNPDPIIPEESNDMWGIASIEGLQEALQAKELELKLTGVR